MTIMTSIAQSEIFSWIEEADTQERQDRILSIRLAIGMSIISRYDELKQNLYIAEEALGRLGLSGLVYPETNIQPVPDIYISSSSYSELGNDLGFGSQGLWSRLRNCLMHQHNDYLRRVSHLKDSSETDKPNSSNEWLENNSHWGEIFNKEGGLSVNKLEVALYSGQLKNIPGIGAKTLVAAEKLVKAKLPDYLNDS